MLTIGLYVDNLERGAYDIPFMMSNWDADKIIIFAGSVVTENILRTQLNDYVDIVNIGIPVSRPPDIPRAFNACTDYCYDVVKTDALLFMHADTHITKACMQFIKDTYDKSYAVSLIYDHIQLYNYMWVAYPSVVLSNTDTIVKWDETGDGSLLQGVYEPRKNYIHHHYDRDMIHDIGYITIDKYVKKMSSHNHITGWKDSWKNQVIDAFGVSKERGLREAYKMIKRYCPLVPIRPEPYAEVLDYYQAWEEYHMCVDFMGKM